jgi:phage-related protein
MADDALKPVVWIASSHDDLCRLSEDVQDEIGYALYFAQNGRRHASAKPLKGFGGAGVLEIVENDSSGTYRAVYTVNYPNVIYVLHVFQKKSKRGIATSRQEIQKIRGRIVIAAAHYQEHKNEYEKFETQDSDGN